MARALCILLFVAAAGTLRAQTLLTNKASVIIRPGTTLTVKGHITSTGVISNQGHIRLSGSWYNGGGYAPGTGKITLNGMSSYAPQALDHNGYAIGNLTLEGIAKKIVRSDLVIAQHLAFGGGILEVLPQARFQMSALAEISGASDQSHVQGAVFHRGSGYKAFPIGNGVHYLPVALSQVDDENALVGIAVMEPANLLLSKPVSLDKISNRRYWHIDVVAGTLGHSQIVLPVREEGDFPDLSSIVVAQAASLTDDFTSLGQSFHEGEASNGSVSSNQAVTMPFVALATASSDMGIVVYNAISANGDGANDFVRILNIEQYPENRFSLFNRWGDRIFYLEGYNNEDRVFRGRSNLHGDKQLVSGTYFYVIAIPGREALRGFISLKN